MSIHKQINFSILIFLFSFLYCSSQNKSKVHRVKSVEGSIIEPIGDINETLMKEYRDSIILYLNRDKLYPPLERICIDYEVNYLPSLDGLTSEFSSFRYELFKSFDNSFLKKLHAKFSSKKNEYCKNTNNMKIEFSKKSNFELIEIIFLERK